MLVQENMPLMKKTIAKITQVISTTSNLQTPYSHLFFTQPFILTRLYII